MKNMLLSYVIYTVLTIVITFPTIAITGCSKEIDRPEVIEPLMPDLGPEGTAGKIQMSSIKSTTILKAGNTGNVYRIPSIITAVDGSLLVFCEARHKSWRDKSYTDIIVMRSTDGGDTWSKEKNLTASINENSEYAFMDPTPVVDSNTGKIFLFCNRWKVFNTNVVNNIPFVVESSDDGLTWTKPKNIASDVMRPGMYCAGFGPGHGISVSSGKYAGRLILISRQSDGNYSIGTTIYSDNHGKTWEFGDVVLAGESQIAESGENQLYLNIRKGGSRCISRSNDGGYSWSAAIQDSSLPFISGGCEASVFGSGGSMVFYCGPAGVQENSKYDNRGKLTLYRSPFGGLGWTRHKELYNKASGYSDMTVATDGSLIIVFEAGPNTGFIKKGGVRPAGWMRLDIIVIPAQIADYDYWFE